ncbi:MAG: hypothetical protein MHPSP_004495, partial [Paramarteilia canceri]
LVYKDAKHILSQFDQLQHYCKVSKNFLSNEPISIEDLVPNKQLPKPIIKPNRTFCDRVLDSFFGDGPNNKYALICKSCYHHNGLCFKEDLPYFSNYMILKIYKN